MDNEKEDPIDEIFRRAGAFSDEEKARTLLIYFAALVEGMDQTTILKLRKVIAAKHVGTPEQALYLEIIDGHLALRGMNLPTPESSTRSPSLTRERNPALS